MKYQHPHKLKTPLFSCAFFRNCTQSALSPTLLSPPPALRRPPLPLLRLKDVRPVPNPPPPPPPVHPLPTASLSGSFHYPVSQFTRSLLPLTSKTSSTSLSFNLPWVPTGTSSTRFNVSSDVWYRTGPSTRLGAKAATTPSSPPISSDS